MHNTTASTSMLLPDGVGYVVVCGGGGEGVEVDQEDVCLLEVLQTSVKLLHHSAPEVARELFLL